MSSIGYDGNMWVALGTDGKVTTSTNGLNWTRPVDSFGGAAMSNVTFGAGLWVAVGADGLLYTSPPGNAPWKLARSCCGITDLTGVAHDASGKLWVTVGDGGKIYTSSAPKATPWTSVASSGFGTIDIAAVASNGSKHWV